MEEAELFILDNGAVDASIFFKSEYSKLSLLLTEPGSGVWEIGKNEISSEGDHNGDGTFDQEQPSPIKIGQPLSKTLTGSDHLPSGQASSAIHAFCDTGSNQTRECS